MEFELFTVNLEENGIVNIDFSEDVQELTTEEELKEELEDKMQEIIPIVNDIVDFLKKKVNKE